MADEITIEEIVINSNIETIDKIAGGEAANDNTAGERVEELTVDPSVELAVLEAAERIDEEVDEAIIDKIAGGEAVLDKIAGGEAVLDNTAGAVVAISDKIAGDGAVLDNTAGGVVAISNKAGERDEAIRVAIDEEVEGPRIESRPQ